MNLFLSILHQTPLRSISPSLLATRKEDREWKMDRRRGWRTREAGAECIKAGSEAGIHHVHISKCSGGFHTLLGVRNLYALRENTMYDIKAKLAVPTLGLNLFLSLSSSPSVSSSRYIPAVPGIWSSSPPSPLANLHPKSPPPRLPAPLDLCKQPPSEMGKRRKWGIFIATFSLFLTTVLLILSSLSAPPIPGSYFFSFNEQKLLPLCLFCLFPFRGIPNSHPACHECTARRGFSFFV